MPRYIDADKLCDGRLSNDPVVIAAGCEPTVDVQEVKHGHWETYLCRLEHTCSCCAATFYSARKCEGMNYCSNCGAKMDGGGTI